MDFGIDSVFCDYYEGRTIVPADEFHPYFRLVYGTKRVFHFGHQYPHVSEPSAVTYKFEVDSARTPFAFDTTDFPGISFKREDFQFGLPPLWHPSGRLEGERTSDSTWLIREWISEDYREWRRRESYRKVRREPGPPPGFERHCVLREAER